MGYVARMQKHYMLQMAIESVRVMIDEYLDCTSMH
jgi:hypothetical protein